MKKVFIPFIFSVFISSLFCLDYKIPEGPSFLMIEVPDSNYFLGAMEVTQELYQFVMEDNPSTFSVEDEDSPFFPVDTVSWYDCIVFCNKLSEKLGKTPVYSVNNSTNPDDWEYEPHGAASITSPVEWNKNADGFRLPSEKEWEYAAFAGKDSKYAGGSSIEDLAWYRKNSGMTPQKCGSKAPNDWGFYDMSGNVWEWVWDKYSEKSLYRIYKGGSAASDKKLCQIKNKGHHYPSRNALCYSYLTFGFRICCNK